MTDAHESLRIDSSTFCAEIRAMTEHVEPPVARVLGMCVTTIENLTESANQRIELLRTLDDAVEALARARRS